MNVEIKEADELLESVTQPEDEGRDVKVNLEVLDVDESYRVSGNSCIVRGHVTTIKTVEIIGDAPKITINTSKSDLFDAIVGITSSLPDDVKDSMNNSNSTNYYNNIRMPIQR